jgi:hypothetical protein
MRLRTIPGWLMLLLAVGSLAKAQTPSPRPAEAPKSPVVCTMDYRPVCGRDKDGKQRTFSNECMAKAAGATGIYPGPCMADITIE